jgi:hypothetical protein
MTDSETTIARVTMFKAIHQLQESQSELAAWMRANPDRTHCVTDNLITVVDQMQWLQTQQGQPRNTTHQVLAVVMLDRPALALVNTINAAKDEAIKASDAFKGSRPYWGLREDPFTRGPEKTQEMRKTNVARYNLKLVRRQFHVITAPASHVGYFLARHHRSYKTLSVRDLRNEFPDTHALVEAVIDEPAAKQLYFSHPIAAHWECNVVTAANPRMRLLCSLPIMLAANTHMPTVAMTEPRPRQSRSSSLGQSIVPGLPYYWRS